jgi:hypothetical protein
LVAERHVFLRNDETANTLLPMPRRELVTELRTTSLTDEDLDEELVVVAVSEHDFVDVASDRSLVRERSVLEGGRHRGDGGVVAVIVSVRGDLLVEVDVSWVDSLSGTGDPVCLKDVVSLFGPAGSGIERSIGDSIVAVAAKDAKGELELATDRPSGKKEVRVLTFRWDTCGSARRSFEGLGIFRSLDQPMPGRIRPRLARTSNVRRRREMSKSEPCSRSEHPRYRTPSNS